MGYLGENIIFTICEAEACSIQYTTAVYSIEPWEVRGYSLYDWRVLRCLAGWYVMLSTFVPHSFSSHLTRAGVGRGVRGGRQYYESAY